MSTTYGAPTGVVTWNVTDPQENTRNTAARAVVSPVGTSLNTISLFGFITARYGTAGTVS